MKILSVVLVLVLAGSNAFSAEPDLVEGARRAIAYYHSLYRQCGGDQVQRNAWYGVIAAGPNAGSGLGWIQMVGELKIHFKTEVLTQEEKLNGYDFKATTSLEPGPYRWWIAGSKAWRFWEVGEIYPPVIVLKKKGGWLTEMAPNRTEPGLKPITTCSEIPASE